MSEQPRNVVPEPLRVQPSHIDKIQVWNSELTFAVHTTVYFEFAKQDEYVCSCGDVSRGSVNNWMINDTRIPLSEIISIDNGPVRETHTTVYYKLANGGRGLSCSCPRPMGDMDNG